MRRPTPVPDELTAFHWEAAAAGRLDVQRCRSCGNRQYPPAVACPRCQSEDLAAEPVSGRGTLYSFTVVRQAFDPALAESIPFVVALVELEEDPTVRILTNIVETPPEELTVGMSVLVAFEQLGDTSLPVFRPC